MKVGPGDAFLFRWGRWTRRDKLGPFNANRESAGLDNSVIPWLKKRDVALLGWETPDYALTIAPLAIPHGTGSPVNPIAMF